MRDPELVFKAQLAASALERAWQNWRVNHGLLADPMPAISSYVGYSLEEPWGQPRVVLGLAAADAEQLTALLERQHDYARPVPAMTAAQPGSRGLAAAADGVAGRPLPVPPQVPSLHAEQKISADGLSGTAEIRYADQADDQDGPVYRQLAAALRVARDVAADEESSEPETAVPEPKGREPEGQDPEGQDPEGQVPEVKGQDPEGQDPTEPQLAARDQAGQEPSGPPQSGEQHVGEESALPEAVGGSDGDSDGQTDHAADIGAGITDGRTGGKARKSRSGDSAGLNQESGKSDSSPADRRAGARKAGSRRAGEGRSSSTGSAANPAGAARASDAADSVANGAAPDGGGPDLATPATPEATATRDEAGPTNHGPGPLALAASAARAAAEARIRAVAQQASASVLERPEAAGQRPEAAGQQPEAAGRRREVAVPAPGDIAAAWGGPGFTARSAEEPEIVRFWPWSQPEAPAEGDPERGRSAAERQDDPQASYARRNRTARGYSIPRLSRAKRPGAVPGS